ncbi:MAG: NusG domain II-containing protein [Candidatus Marithrix sp.]|nr:NusG domain II-containing protein [Candidatus Marithrix sp.]
MSNSYILNSITTFDYIIFSLAIILIIWLYISYWGGEVLDYAIILSADNITQSINLQHPQQIIIQGAIGESKIEVLNNQIRFVKSPCKQQYCVHAGWLTETKNFVTCLPNQISIKLPHANKFDSISY